MNLIIFHCRDVSVSVCPSASALLPAAANCCERTTHIDPKYDFLPPNPFATADVIVLSYSEDLSKQGREEERRLPTARHISSAV